MQVQYMYIFQLFCFSSWKSLKALEFEFTNLIFQKRYKVLEVQASSSLIPLRIELQCKRHGKFSHFYHSSTSKELRTPHTEYQDLYLWYVFQNSTVIEFATRFHFKQSNFLILVIKSLIEQKFSSRRSFFSNVKLPNQNEDLEIQFSTYC